METQNLIKALLFAVLIPVSACKSPEITEGEAEGIDEELVAAFSGNTDYGFYSGNTDPEYTLDLLTQEMIYNTKSGKFMIQDEDRNVLVSVTLTPSGQDGFYSVEIESAEADIRKGSFRMKAVKHEGDRIWLWETGNGFGIIILGPSRLEA